MRLAILVFLLQPRPDPRQMSGLPLPASDMPKGMLSVRLTRGDLSEAIVGEEVVISGAVERKEKTGADGRAYFKDLPTDVELVISARGASPKSFSLHTTGVRMILFVESAAPPPASPPLASQPPASPHALSQPSGSQDPHALSQPSGSQAPHPMPESAPHSNADTAIDAARISGVPLASPDLPTGTLTVRIAFGSFKETLPEAEVKLAVISGESSSIRTSNADETGRARFDDIPASARVTPAVLHRGESFASPAFDMPSEGGARMMLFVPKEAGSVAAPATIERDRSLPGGTVVVRLVRGDDQPIAASEVELVRAFRDNRVERVRATTNEQGIARFDGQSTTRDVAYFAAVQHSGTVFTTAPFQLQANTGVRTQLRVSDRTSDSSVLRIGMRSHIVIDPEEESVTIVEALQIENQSPDTFEPGPDGLVLALPEGEQSASLDEESPKQIRVEDGRLVWRGAVPPGSHDIRFFLRKSVTDEKMEFRQRTQLPWPHVTVVVPVASGVTVKGAGMSAGEARDLGAQKFMVFRGSAVSAGGEIRFSLHGLPRPDTTARNVAGAFSLLILLWGMVVGWRRSRAPDDEID